MNNMEKFKLENFKREYGFDMPIKKHLSYDECCEILSNIYLKFHVNDIKDLFSKLENESLLITNINNGTVNIENIFLNLNIGVSQNVFINWFKFDNIDSISFKDLCKYFDDIWYPSVDDIEIFDETYNWILSIKYYGIISFLKSVDNT